MNFKFYFSNFSHQNQQQQVIQRLNPMIYEPVNRDNNPRDENQNNYALHVNLGGINFNGRRRRNRERNAGLVGGVLANRQRRLVNDLTEGIFN